MPRTKYVYSVYDIEKKAHIAFFSSLDKAREFVLAHGINIYQKGWYQIGHDVSYGKQMACYNFSPTNSYNLRYIGNTHIYVKIALDKNAQLDLNIE